MELRTGKELFTMGGQPIDLLSMLDFWQFQFSNIFDLQEHIAEFLVAKALRIKKPYNRDGWTQWDINYKKTRIEVKETGYYYSWQKNKKKSDVRTWDIHKTYTLDEKKERIKIGEDSKGNAIYKQERQSDIYVFCLNTGKQKKSSNPLQLEHWEFYIIPTSTINEVCGDNKSISLSKVKKLAKQSTPFGELKSKIDQIISQIKKYNI